ncbi:hypothetical protein Tmar_2068 [Thermaerobacter marianensis DSM 12885]|uniref:Uncharacterized protein n=1 Tax=Thermaerobacter marianensis (strain ATCC 700841 / DSM 12885 / JCM 10246 / 7p75a) TaxID=644966 RepID=E6SJJ4_THEM7|nr:hypothetical protein [Thermaerobacter marianensis]ADU52149.1 hypothetical protein Tmar_2068 [Thermaerobacter marianensis DSM 12885]
MAAILRLVLSVVVWLGGLAATRAVIEPVVRQGGEAFPQLAWPALGVALLGAAGGYGILAAAWGRWMDGRSVWLRLPLALIWAVLAALFVLAAVRGMVRVEPATAGTPTAPALLLALLGSRPLWAAGLLLALAGATIGARPAERRRRLGPGRFGV